MTPIDQHVKLSIIYMTLDLVDNNSNEFNCIFNNTNILQFDFALPLDSLILVVV